MTTVGAAETEDTLLKSLALGLGDLGRGSTAPTEVTIGGTPTIPALLFDAVAETASANVIMSTDWDKSKDVIFALVWSLVNTQNDGHVLDVTLDYVAILNETTGGGADKTSSQVLATQTLATANGLAINDVYVLVATLAAADANNGFAAGDKTVGFGIEFHLTNLTDVAAIHVLGERIVYEANY